MDVIQAIKSRTSTRKYINKPVPEDILKDIIDCGRLAPNGSNRQPWMFVVVTDQELRNHIANSTRYGKFIREAGACVAVFCSRAGLTLLEDACAATENMIIAAQAYGLGTCWVNSHKEEHSEEVKRLLNCPAEYELMTMIAVGYPDMRGSVQKKSLAEVLRWNTF